MKQSKGITLVALVITIILMLLLAGISIQAMTGTGIFESAKRAELENKRAQVSEYLNLKLLTQQMLNSTGSAEQIIKATREDVNKNISELKEIGKEVTVEETSTEEDGEEVEIYFYVIVDKDVYKVSLKGVEFIGEQGKFPPIIKIESATSTTNSITVKVKTWRNQGGKIKYYIKTENEEKYTEKETTTEETYTYTELEQNKTYSIKIEAIAENKQTAEVTKDITVGSVPNIEEGDIIFTYTVDGTEINKETWTNKTVTVTATLNTDITGFTLQTSKDGENWENTASQVFTENGKIYITLYDGKNYGGSATGNITNIDKLAPNEFTPTVETNTITSLKVTGKTTDKEATEKYEKSEIKQYYFSKDNGATWVTNNSNSYIFDNLTYAQTYNIKMKAEDNAGNVTITNAVNAYPGYIQEGLVVHYDGINNTGNGHSNTTSTWKDISGNGNDMPLYNFNYNSDSGWISDGIIFDGVDDYMTTTNPLFNGIGNNHSATIEIISETTKSQYGNILDLGGHQVNKTSPPYLLWASEINDGTSRCNSVYFGNKIYNIPQNKIYLNQLNSISFGSDLTKNYIYVDGGNTYINEDTAEESGWKANIFSLGRDWEYYAINGDYCPDFHCYFIGKIKSVRIYDRLLSKEEIELNYKLDNQRYKIK